MNNAQLTNKNRKLSPLKAIRLYCKNQCSAGDLKSWKNCTFSNCFLFGYRFGKLNQNSSENRGLLHMNFSKKPHLKPALKPKIRQEKENEM